MKCTPYAKTNLNETAWVFLFIPVAKERREPYWRVLSATRFMCSPICLNGTALVICCSITNKAALNKSLLEELVSKDLVAYGLPRSVAVTKRQKHEHAEFRHMWPDPLCTLHTALILHGSAARCMIHDARSTMNDARGLLRDARKVHRPLLARAARLRIKRTNCFSAVQVGCFSAIIGPGSRAPKGTQITRTTQHVLDRVPTQKSLKFLFSSNTQKNWSRGPWKTRKFTQ